MAIYVCHWDLDRLRARGYAVPGGLESLFRLTQHSACGCVLGYHVPAPVPPHEARRFAGTPASGLFFGLP